MLKILIADDHEIVRKGLGKVLAEIENSDLNYRSSCGRARGAVSRLS